MCGLAVGITRMILDFIYEKPACGMMDERPLVVQKLQFHYMYFALLLFGITCIVAICISYATRKVPKEYVSGWVSFVLFVYFEISISSC